MIRVARGDRSISVAARMLLASAALAVVVSAVFIVLLLAVLSLRDATDREAEAKDVTAATLVLEKLVLNLETGLRGLALTGDERFLQPWREARAQLPERLSELERMTASDRELAREAGALATLINAYVDDYSVPLVDIAQESPTVAQSRDAIGEGRRRTDAIQARIDRLLAAAERRAAASTMAATNESGRAIALGVAGLFGSVALIILFGLFLARSIARPVREVAAGANRLAAGSDSPRLAEAGPGEVGELTRAFNTMAEKLEQGRSELENQNAQLRESEQLKSELVRIVSHEVRTPLASVLGFTSVLMERDVDEETRSRYLTIIDTQAKRLRTLLDDFLAVERLEEGQLEFSRELVDVAEILREQSELFVTGSPEHDLVLDVPPSPLLVLGDSNRLAQVVGNILSNAVKYSPRGGTVEVVGGQDDRIVRVDVRDEGIGIPETLHERVFTKFFRGSAEENGIAGTGLGLAFSRAVVEAHGGRIGFTSRPGAGSTFSIELPTAAGG